MFMTRDEKEVLLMLAEKASEEKGFFTGLNNKILREAENANRIEKKLNLLVSHLNLRFRTTDAIPEKLILEKKEKQ